MIRADFASCPSVCLSTVAALLGNGCTSSSLVRSFLYAVVLSPVRSGLVLPLVRPFFSLFYAFYAFCAFVVRLDSAFRYLSFASTVIACLRSSAQSFSPRSDIHGSEPERIRVSRGGLTFRTNARDSAKESDESDEFLRVPSRRYFPRPMSCHFVTTVSDLPNTAS